MNFILAIFLFSVFSLTVKSKKQTITVKGVLLCNRKPQEGIELILKEKDTLSPDDTLSTTKSAKNGSFFITGSEDEVLSIEPYLNIIHTCGVSKKGCKRTTTYTFTKKEVNTIVNLDIINLNNRGQIDEEKC
uniref:Transthyretin-like family protein n=1 Tax=Parastrongyloides trichosuri TaxID=131310 RepID=A0A0N4ZN37_PARTI